MNHKTVDDERWSHFLTKKIAIALQFEIFLVSRLLGDTGMNERKNIGGVPICMILDKPLLVP